MFKSFWLFGSRLNIIKELLYSFPTGTANDSVSIGG
jgi:hypothetical protein